MARSTLLVLAALLVVACERTPEPQERPPKPVTVYAGYLDAEPLKQTFEKFTQQSGIRVTVKAGDPRLIVDAVIANNGAPPADVLLTPDVAGIWRAAEEGGLRAIHSDVMQENVATRLRDPDRLWTAVGYTKAAIAYDQRAVDLSGATGYEVLGDESLRGRLCLSSSSLSINRALIAMMISEVDIRPTERIVRSWIRNLAQPVFDSEQQLLAAIIDGECAAGIVSTDAFVGHVVPDAGESLGINEPPQAFVNITGIGIARHARNPEGAQLLIEWLVSKSALSDEHLDGISEKNVGMAGWNDEDAAKLAERTSYP